jgi:hypothetical protein
VAPLRIETGRYENKNVNERVCFICHDQIEDEKHVLLDSPLYADLQSSNCVITFLCKIFSKSVYSSKLHSLNFVIILKHQFFFLLTAFLNIHKTL